ncbi:MAG: hypothetical protein AB7G38_19100 [Dehalococcoidia bacterium]
MRLLQIAPLLVLAAALFACSSSDEPAATPTAPANTATAQPTATSTPTPLPTPTPVRPAAQPFPDTLKQSSDAVFEQIAAARGVAIKAPVDMFILTREQARAFYTSTGGVTGSSGESSPGGNTGPPLNIQQEVYDVLGLIPERKPPQSSGQAAPPTLQESQVDNLISLITGFYSPELNALYLVESATGSRSTIVHELTHALQYQYADIPKIERQRANDWDATTALLDVLEGDAVNTEIQLLGFSTRQSYRQPVCFTIPAPQRAGTPYVVERELDTWYEDGLCFVQALAGQRGFEALFADLPTTTEQILHPEKYLAGEGRIPVTLPSLTPALGSEWRRASGSTFGEFMLQNVLLTGLKTQRGLVQSAAAGWGGDAWSLYVNGDGRLLQTDITWDTPEDAAEFWSALLTSLVAQGATPPPAEAPAFEVTVGTTTWRGVLSGSTTKLIVSNDAAAAQKVVLP